MDTSILLNQLRDYRQETLDFLETISEEMADIIPPGHSNNIRWNAGHIYVDRYLWFYHKVSDTCDFPKGYPEMFAHGTRPVDWKRTPPTMEELTAHLKEQTDHLIDVFGERLDEPLLEPSESGMHTIGHVIPRTLFHEGIHIGIMMSIKKQILAQSR